MDNYQFLLPIGVAILLGSMSPGPSFLLVAKTAVERSRMHGFAVALGMGAGAVVFALLASLGLYLVLETIPSVYLGLKLVGGVYLCYLAYRFWRSASQPASSETDTLDGESVGVRAKGVMQSFLLGLFTQLSNPKTAIVMGGIFAAFLPREIPSAAHAILAIMTFVLDVCWYSFVVVTLSTRHARAVYFRFKKPISRLASGFMGVIGIKLALGG